MAFDFPTSPAVGQTYSGYVWNGYAWVMTAAISVSATPGDNPPTTPVPGQLWWESDTGNLFVWYVDANSSQWVQISATGFSDAPKDGKDYVRRDGAWAAVRLSTKLTAPSDQMTIDNLEADTLYRCSVLLVPGTVDCTVYWQSRMIAGGAWDQAAGSYSRQSISGYSTSVVSSVTTEGSSLIQGLDTGTQNRAAHVQSEFYSGSTGRWPVMTLITGGLSSDASVIGVNINYTDRRANGPAVSVRIVSDVANGLGAGSRFFMERLG